MKTILLTLFVVISLAHSSPQKYGRFYISGQPTEEELTSFKKNTGAVVMDLRSIDELGNCSEPATVSKLGMQYGRVLFEKSATIDPEVIKQIDQQVADAKDKPVFLFCKSGNRASAWLAIHLVKKENKSIDEAVSIAKTTGLKSDMEKAVREYLQKN
tara:strand:+ start:34869 stop:35339 length:471 start_codon:yes stop_codon:yes gene_type:complete